MARLIAYNFISLNGYFKGENEDISWHKHGQEESEFSEENLKSENILLFGRKTYEMMASFWPTQIAHEQFPVVAEGMNKAEKIVFSKSIDRATWNNTRVVRSDLLGELRKLKEGEKDMTILGSGTIITQCAEKGLLDELQVTVDPLILEKGIPIFHDIKKDIDLHLQSNRTLSNGVMLLIYHLARNKHIL